MSRPRRVVVRRRTKGRGTRAPAGAAEAAVHREGIRITSFRMVGAERAFNLEDDRSGTAFRSFRGPNFRIFVICQAGLTETFPGNPRRLARAAIEISAARTLGEPAPKLASRLPPSGDALMQLLRAARRASARSWRVSAVRADDAAYAASTRELDAGGLHESFTRWQQRVRLHFPTPALLARAPARHVAALRPFRGEMAV
jgi:hypothetical protein